MTRLPTLKAEQAIKALQKAGFVAVRQRGGHIRLKHGDGRVTTVPNHPAQDIGRGLVRKILRDTEISVDELLKLLQ
jgi:predicted RNA binding protein YcfA (HicA-like mRNA interferase family)